MIKKSVKKRVLRTTIEVAVKEFYDKQIKGTKFERDNIGVEKKYFSKVDWMEEKIGNWISKAKERIG